MEKKESGSSNIAVLGVILVSVFIIITIIYFKVNADDVSGYQTVESKFPVAVPDTTLSFDLVEEAAEAGKTDSLAETLFEEQSLEKDTRTAIEAGDEDGYWDGWYDGTETGKRTRFDDHSSFASSRERELYAASYRDGYEKGFAESVLQKGK